jgi:hypothetical protein
MKTILLFLLLFPALLKAQEKSYFSCSGSLYVPGQFKNTAYGIDISENISIVDGVYLGITSGFIKLEHTNKPYIPVSARITYYPIETNSKLIPFLLSEAGYGIYNEQLTANNDVRATVRGGFTCFEGLGFKVATTEVSRVNPFFALGFSSSIFRYAYQIKNSSGTTKESNSTDQSRRITLKLGVMF